MRRSRWPWINVLAAVVGFTAAYLLLDWRWKTFGHGEEPWAAGLNGPVRIPSQSASNAHSDLLLSSDERQALVAAHRNFMVNRVRSDIAALATITRSQIVYNRPKTLPYDKPSRLVAVIVSHSMQDAKRRLADGTGRPQIRAAEVAPRVRAELQGVTSQVDIQDVGSAVKAVTGIQNPSWSWYVTPKTTDPIQLTLSFYNQVDVGNGSGEIDGPVFVDKFIVESTLWDRILSWCKSFGPTYALVAGGITTIYAFVKWLADLRRKGPPAAQPALRARTKRRKRR